MHCFHSLEDPCLVVASQLEGSFIKKPPLAPCSPWSRLPLSPVNPAPIIAPKDQHSCKLCVSGILMDLLKELGH